MLLPALPIGFALVAVTAASALAARRLGVPVSIVLVLVGLTLSFTPFMPRVVLEPELVLTLLLPPLLYSAGVGMSWRGFKAELRPILQLAVGLVVFTAVAVALIGHYLLALPLAVAFVLGAVVSPPDAVAPMAIARRSAMPQRVLTILEGEGLVNDATALILFSFAVAAVVGGTFSLGRALGEFVLIVGGELCWGVFIGWGGLWLRRWSRETRVEMVIALLTPFAAFWVPEALGGSGVLATVTAGLYVSWNGPRYISPATRLQGFFVWDMVVYVVEGVIFLVTGLQARAIAERLPPDGWAQVALIAAVVCAVVIAVRFAWVFLVAYVLRPLLPARWRTALPPRRQVFVIAFTGLRGVVSLAAVLSIPLTAGDAPFPYRDLLLLVTFAVILVTLVGQGLSFAWVIARLGLVDDGLKEAAEAKQREVAARVKSIDAALARLDALEGAASSPDTVAALRRRSADRRAYFVAACHDLAEGQLALSSAALMLRFLEAERASITDLYCAGEIDDDARRRIERELDLEEARLRHAAISGTPRI
ncbi:MAG: Na+/H+ antiporter [Alphaproteobacteria bacterium]|nr:Na+/H+ antiporter [Alphaproteobacteria bacterium]